MPLDTIGNRSQLQHTTLISDINTETQEVEQTSVTGLQGAKGERVISLSTPGGVHGTVNGSDNGVRRLSDLKLDGIPPRDIGTKRDQTVGQINALINAIEADRASNGGELSPQGQALRETIDLLGDTFAQLSEGPTVGDKLMARMESLEGLGETLQARLNEGFEHLPDEVQGQVRSLCENLRAQVQDRVAYLGHTIADSPFSLSKMYESKAQFSDAAIRVINEQLKRTDLTYTNRGRLEWARDNIFHDRARDLRRAASENTGKLGDPNEVVGKKPAKGLLGKLFAGDQNRARELHAKQLFHGGHTPLNTPKIDEQTIVQDALKLVFEDAGLPVRSIGLALDHALNHAMNEVLNKDQEWAPIVKEIQLQSGSETVLSYSETTPAGNFIKAYEGKGFNAHSSTEYTHAVNLAQTKLTDGQGTVLFDGLRHGVISAFGINAGEIKHMSDEELAPMVETLLPKEMWVRENERLVNMMSTLDNIGITADDGDDRPQIGEISLKETLAAVREDASLVDAMRREANFNRAHETVLATLLTDPQLMERALAGETVPVDILSISLLTPDNIRPMIKGAHENERQMVQDQMQAWQDVSGPQTFTVTDADGQAREITVDVRPVACNYGVNAGGVGSASWLAGGWDNVAGLNGEALGQLLGDDIESIANGGLPGGLIGQRMQDLELQIDADRENLTRWQGIGDQEMIAHFSAKLRLNEPKLAQARELTQQIAQIQQDGSYKIAGSEPYKMPTRLAVLAEMFDVKVMWNCKSGKDRTGELDAEIKHFKLQTGLTGKVPHYERTRSPSEIAQFHEVVTHSGNFEMQRLNTGYAGYKLLGVNSLYEQFGGQNKHDEVTANFLGLSGYTKS